MSIDYVYLAIPIILIRYVMIYNYLFICKKSYLSTLEKLYLLDLWAVIVVIALYLHYVDQPQVIMIIGFIITTIVILVGQKLYIQQLKYTKYEVYFRKSRDIRDFEEFQTEFSKELYVEESTKNLTLGVFFKNPDNKRNISILKLLTMNRELFKLYDEKNRRLYGLLGIGLLFILLGLFGYLLVTMPVL